MNFLVDTHSHIYYDQYKDDLSKVINDADNSEIKRIVCVGTDLETSHQSIEIANKYDNVFCTVGCHPHEASKMGAGYLKIVNNTKKEVLLKSISSKISKRQEIHNVLLVNDTYKMRPIKNGLKILPGEELIFEPKSYHIMFFEMNKKYKNEEMLEAKLNFNNDVIINIKFKVLLGNKEHNHH